MRTCEILLANNDKIIKLIEQALNLKSNKIKQMSIVINAQSLQKAIMLT